MKKMILSAILVCGFTISMYGQVKNDFWGGGNISAWTSKTDGQSRLTGIRILPELGYQFHDNWGVGMQFGYVHDQFHGNGMVEKTDGLYVSPFVRYSYLKGQWGNLFVDGLFGYGYDQSRSSGHLTRHTIDVGFRPGVGVNITDNISLIGKVGFLGYEYEKLGDVKTHNAGLQLDLGRVDLGVIVRF